jgi:hypothetical protein
MTLNSGDRLEHWLERALEWADEIVLLVDSASTDDTLDIACAYADSVQVVEHPPVIEVAMDWGLRRATGEWVLWLDDDELLSRSFADHRDELLDRPDLTHYWLPYRWVVGDSDVGYRWLGQFPWHPNERLRLVRNVGSIYSHRGRLHSPIEVAGEGEVADPARAVVYHMDLAWRSRRQREEKVARYRVKNAPSCEEYYLWEDYEADLRTHAVTEDLVRPPSAAARAAAADRVRHHRAAPRANLDTEVPTVGQMTRRLASHWDTADVFHADWLGHATPPRVLPNRGYTASITVRNGSAVRWRTTGLPRGRVALAYHWVHPDHGLLLEQGDRTLLPRAVEPGQSVDLEAGFWTPYEPGRYQLQWDLRAEEIGWFSERGVPPLEVTVEVTAGDGAPLVGRPREVATLPPRASAGPPTAGAAGSQRVAHLVSDLRRRLRPGPAGLDLRACNVVPMAAVRALDTRDGSGAPGARPGPLPSDGLIELAVGGHLGVPSHAVAVIAGLAVPSATYNGFLTAFAADGTSGDAFVSLYFNDRGVPTADQVLVALGRAPHQGRVALHASGNHPGGVHVIVDVVAYVA